MNKPLRLIIGTRGSVLALTQSRTVAAAIQRHFPDVDTQISVIKTQGDIDRSTPLSEFGGTGLFVKEIEQSLMSEQVDIAVHSMKDVPTEIDPRSVIVSALDRKDARDVLVSRGGLALSALSSGAVLGTSSPRRRAQVLRVRKDLRIEELRGNLNTRLRKLDEGRYDAIIVAYAGIIRLGLADNVTEIFDVNAMVPAVGQGALAIQMRCGDERVVEKIATLTTPSVETAVAAERAFLTELGGGCQKPIGAHAVVEGDQLTIVGYVSDPQGARCFQEQLAGSAAEPQILGARLAGQLLNSGAAAILK